MRLYHYTARHHIEGGPGHAGSGIVHVGIRPNVHPYIDLARGVVWLTDDEAWAQPWASRPVPGLDCDRTEARVEVAIPKSERRLLLRWQDVRPLVLTEQMARDMERYANPDRWFVFGGRIPSGWLRGVEHRPMAAVA